MALSEQKLQQAKDEAKRYLEYSTYIGALALGIDPDELAHPYEIPVDRTHSDYAIHQSIATQISALTKLQ